MLQVRLKSARMLSSSVRELTFEPSEPIVFTPGQWVTFKFSIPEHEELRRSYSIASAPRADGSFDIAVTRVEQGPVSSILHELSIGSSLSMLKPQGHFVLREVARPILMIATGTGVSPFRSIVQAMASTSISVPTVLIFGARTERDILYQDEFQNVASVSNQFQFIPTLSQASTGWAGRRGYVQEHLKEHVQALASDCDAYICGLSKMVREVRQILREELLLPRQHVHSERYD